MIHDQITHEPREIDENDLSRLLNSQLRHTIHYALNILEGRWTDSDYDYMTSALDLSNKLLSLTYESDVRGLNELLTDTVIDPENPDADSDELQILGDYACDGICPAIWHAAGIQ